MITVWLQYLKEKILVPLKVLRLGVRLWRNTEGSLSHFMIHHLICLHLYLGGPRKSNEFKEEVSYIKYTNPKTLSH